MLTLGCHGSPPYHYNLPNLLLNLNLNIPARRDSRANGITSGFNRANDLETMTKTNKGKQRQRQRHKNTKTGTYLESYIAFLTQKSAIILLGWNWTFFNPSL